MEDLVRETMAVDDLQKARDLYLRLIESIPQKSLYLTYLDEVYQPLGNGAEAQKCRAAAMAILAPEPPP